MSILSSCSLALGVCTFSWRSIAEQRSSSNMKLSRHWNLILYTCLQFALSHLLVPRSLTFVHLGMSKDELQQTFAVDRHEDVPVYQLVALKFLPVLHVGPVVLRRVKFTALGKSFHLNLIPNKELSTQINILQAEKKGGMDNITIDTLIDKSDLHIGFIYQDIKNHASFVLNENAGKFEVNGVVENLVINHLPLRISHKYPVRDVGNSSGNDASVLSDYHVIYQQSYTGINRGGGALNDFNLLSPSLLSFKLEYDLLNRRKRDVPRLYPELLIIVDYGLYKRFNHDARTLKKYVFSFVSAVDLRYRTIQSPQISFSVAAITIITSEGSAPYLDQGTEGDKLNAEAALAATGHYLFLEQQFPVYDAAVVLTDRDLCKRFGTWGTCDERITGYAYVAGGCRISKLYERVSSVALIEDSGGYSGVIVTAHELGHLLGAVHDGSPPTSYIGGRGARHCSWNDGYIMSDERRDYRGLHFSPCSIEQFDYFARSVLSNCMRNYPSDPGRRRSHVLPGKLLSLDAQCKRERHSSACFHDHRVCIQLFCFEPSTGYCVAVHPAVEGSSCGEGSHCIDGFCQPESS